MTMSVNRTPRSSRPAGRRRDAWRMSGALLSGYLLLTGCAQDARPIVISDAWAPATPPNARVAATYMRIEARGGDVFMSARTPVASSVELHQTYNEDGMMKMRPADTLLIAPSRPVALEPNGTHFMLVGLQAPLEADSRFVMTLRFEKAGEVPVEVRVVAPDADHAHH